ncbi:outer membrane protein assembly factor BamD [Abditibacteriota bacterium]|nr:outer membrane protein assembly factor BamD [Abditibacteriota bacterium]
MKRHSLIVPLLVFALASTSLSSVVWAETPQEQYHTASGLYDARLYSTAAQELKKFLDANPTDTNAKIAAYQWAGALYRTQKDGDVDYPAAIKAYQWALQKYPTAPANMVAAARFELGEAYYLSNKPTETISALTEFLKNPGTDKDAPTRSGWANYYLGKSYSDLKKPAQARAAFETVQSKFATTEAAPDSLLELGLINMDAGQNAAAIALFTNLRAKFPDSDAAPEARVYLGEAQLSAKNYGAARETLRAALNDPKLSGDQNKDLKIEALQDLADTDFTEKKWEEATQSYDALLQSLPANDARRLNAQLQRGNAFFNAKNWGAALENYAPLVKSGGKTAPPALYYSASSLFEQSKFSEAAGLYRQFLASFPNHDLAPKAALRLGDALADAKDPAQAAQAYKMVLTRFPGSKSAKDAQDALTDLAGTQDAGTGDAIEKVLSGLPASAVSNAQLRLAQAAFDRGDFAKSAQLASVVATAKPDATTTENALYLIGSARLNAKDAPGAASAFTKQVTTFPKGKLAAQGNLGLAWAFEDQKKWADSEKAARAALLAGGEKDRAQLALASALLNGGKLAPAVTVFAVVEKSTDKTFAAQGAQGGALALEKQSLWREAAARWGKRATLVSDGDVKARAYIRQGLALGKAKDNASAQLAFDAAVTAAPKSDMGAQALYEAAWLAHDAKQTQVESARWTRLETDFPDSKLTPEAIFQNGELALSAKKWDEAAATYERLLQKYPADKLAPNANFSQGTAYYNAQKWTEAAAAFDKVGPSKESFSLEAPFWAAESLRKGSNLTEAGSRYQKFVQAVENNAKATAELKALLPAARLGWGQSVSTPAQAATIYQPALASAQGKTKTELSFRLGEALTAQNKWSQAVPVLLPVATSENDWTAPAQWWLAQSLENTGAKADALAMYQKLAKSQPSNQWTEKAAAHIKELAP